MGSEDVINDVFISYSSNDVAFAEHLEAALTKANPRLKVWRDKRRLIPGEHVDFTIPAALKQSCAVAVLWSENSIQSDWVKKEASWAEVEDRIASLSIGSFDHRKLPSTSRQYHCGKLDEILADPSPLLERIANLSRSGRRTRRKRLSLSIAPFTINCMQQVDTLQGMIEEYCGSGAQHPVQRPLFALRAQREDTPELLMTRMALHDLPAMSIEGAEIEESERRLITLQWPVEGRNREAALREQIHQVARQRNGRARRLSIRPSIIDTPTGMDVALVKEWLKAWDDGLAPENGAIPFLVLVDQPSRFGRMLGLKNAYAEQILDAVRSFATVKSRGVVLAPLRPIQRQDAALWIEHAIPEGKHAQSIEFVTDRFTGSWKHAQPRLGQFAEAVIDQPWWKELANESG